MLRLRIPSYMKRRVDTPQGWAVASAAACILTGVGAAGLAASGARAIWLAVWLVACGVGALAMAGLTYRRWGERRDLVHLAERILLELDGQARSLAQEQLQIERLQANIADEDLRRQIENRLGGSAQPALLALIGQLIQAEEAVPEAAAVTKSWISRARNIASHTHVQLEHVREEVGGR